MSDAEAGVRPHVASRVTTSSPAQGSQRPAAHATPAYACGSVQHSRDYIGLPDSATTAGQVVVAAVYSCTVHVALNRSARSQLEPVA